VFPDRRVDSPLFQIRNMNSQPEQHSASIDAAIANHA